jgi:hypothetical protein
MTSQRSSLSSCGEMRILRLIIIFVVLILSVGLFSSTVEAQTSLVITSFTPLSAASGAYVVVSGYNLNEATSVKFGGTDAQVALSP